MDKIEILADLRKQFGSGAYLYAKDIAVLLGKPSTGAVYELIKRKGLPWPVVSVGGLLAVRIYDVAASMAGDEPQITKKTKPPEPGKPVLAAPKYKVNKELTKALSLLRAQQHFIGQVSAEIETLILENEVTTKRAPAEESPKKPPKTTKKRV